MGLSRLLWAEVADKRCSRFGETSSKEKARPKQRTDGGDPNEIRTRVTGVRGGYTSAVMSRSWPRGSVTK